MTHRRYDGYNYYLLLFVKVSEVNQIEEVEHESRFIHAFAVPELVKPGKCLKINVSNNDHG